MNLRISAAAALLLAAVPFVHAAPPASPNVTITSLTPQYITFAPNQTSVNMTVGYQYDHFTGSPVNVTVSSPSASLTHTVSGVVITTGATGGSGTITLTIPNTVTTCAPRNVKVQLDDPADSHDNGSSNASGNSFVVIGPACSTAPPGGGGSSLTTTTVTSDHNPSNLAQAIIITATVSTAGTNAPTGTVDFFDNTTSTDLGTATLPGVGLSQTASLPSLSTLAMGGHDIYASYSGDGNNFGSQGFYTQNVEQNTAYLKACKWYDANNNGLNDDSQPISGWSMTVDSLTTQTTGADGCTTFNNLTVAAHTISEGTLAAPYVQTALIVGGSPLTPATSTSVTLTAGNDVNHPLEVDFGNNKQITLSGTKFYDANASTPGASTNEDGTMNNSEAGITGVKVSVTECADSSCLTGYIGSPAAFYTATGGAWTTTPYVFATNSTTARNFLICENIPASTTSGNFFVQTGPVPNATPSQGSSCYYGAYSQTTTGRDFGNVCVAPGLSQDGSKGGWANHGTISSQSVSALAGENFVDNGGNTVTFANATDVANFLGGTGPHNNGAYQLSLQLAAMTIDATQILNPGISTAYASAGLSACGMTGNYFTVTQLLAAASAAIAAHPLTTTGNACQSALESLLDGMANNHSLYVQTSAAACPFVTPY
ncbi:MAG TPA: Ig-like domain-containing protein [Candidatus Sulfopaludibacter sp.]|jgi:hypothetical protein|nr:Ig-like domain-containing protein [Candidatus Sulfopaludibacter sp.]